MSTMTTEARAKSSTIRATLAYLEKLGGTRLVDSVLNQLAPDLRRKVSVASAQPEVPFELMSELLNAADRAIGGSRPGWAEEAGAFAISSSGTDLYGGILRKSNPAEFLTQPVSLFQLYYQPGDMIVVEQDEARAVLRLIDFPHHNPLFCQRQTGGLRRALEVAGGWRTEVRHVRCTQHGDAFCEWQLSWSHP